MSITLHGISALPAKDSHSFVGLSHRIESLTKTRVKQRSNCLEKTSHQGTKRDMAH